jgi:protein-tyrosine-phosphatase
MSPRDEHPLVSLLRRPFRALRALWETSRHPSRRRRAEEVVVAVGPPRLVLFLCTGNICRSPYAEKVFQRLGAGVEGPRIEAASAGFLAAGRSSPEPAVRIAGERGISLREHRSKQADGELLTQADLVIAMETAHAAKVLAVLGQAPRALLLLGDLDPLLPGRREIQDPWGHDDRVFKDSFERIDRCVARLGDLLRIEAREGGAERRSG